MRVTCYARKEGGGIGRRISRIRFLPDLKQFDGIFDATFSPSPPSSSIVNSILVSERSRSFIFVSCFFLFFFFFFFFYIPGFLLPGF